MDEPRWLDADQQKAWRGLLVLVNRGMPVLDRTLREHGLLSVHYAVLVALSGAPLHTLRLSELADIANLSQSRLTHRMRMLVDKGVVTIEPDPQDGRAKNAVLTSAGMKWLEKVAPIHAEDVQQLIFDHLNPDETRVLGTALAKVAGSLCDHPHFQLHGDEC
jgi:DNA-binding MarR family transcriptional regulator